MLRVGDWGCRVLGCKGFGCTVSTNITTANVTLRTTPHMHKIPPLEHIYNKPRGRSSKNRARGATRNSGVGGAGVMIGILRANVHV